ncbi:MAG: hypothetical protein WC516_07765 [Patescibacteria group bacterium]|jgi:hypothetical protein
MKAVRERNFTHICKQCDHMWFSALEEPSRCPRCETRYWNSSSEVRDLYIPIPVFDHSEKKRLRCLGGRCPYCKGTTGTDSVERVGFCHSCDAIFDIVSLEFLGVQVGIGVR